MSSNICLPAEEVHDALRVTAHGVEDEGHAEAEDCADEEEGEDELLLELDVRFGARQKPGGQDQERCTAWNVGWWSNKRKKIGLENWNGMCVNCERWN